VTVVWRTVETWRVVELHQTSLWMRRLGDWLLSRSRDGQEVLPVDGKAVAWILPAITSIQKASTRQERRQKLEQIGQRTARLAGDWSRRCASGGQGHSVSRAWGREGLTMVTHPEWVAGLMTVSGSVRGSTEEEEETKFTRCSKGSSKSST